MTVQNNIEKDWLFSSRTYFVSISILFTLRFYGIIYKSVNHRQIAANYSIASFLYCVFVANVFIQIEVRKRKLTVFLRREYYSRSHACI